MFFPYSCAKFGVFLDLSSSLHVHKKTSCSQKKGSRNLDSRDFFRKKLIEKPWHPKEKLLSFNWESGWSDTNFKKVEDLGPKMRGSKLTVFSEDERKLVFQHTFAWNAYDKSSLGNQNVD